MTTIPAHFDGESFVPDEPVTALRPGDRVEVVPLAGSPAAGEHPVPSESIKDPLLGLIDLAVDTGITDLAENADHYLYGHPKQSDELHGG